jgi:hypothetical protein
MDLYFKTFMDTINNSSTSHDGHNAVIYYNTCDKSQAYMFFY